MCPRVGIVPDTSRVGTTALRRHNLPHMTTEITLSDEQVQLLLRTLTTVEGATDKWSSFYVDEESAEQVGALQHDIAEQVES